MYVARISLEFGRKATLELYLDLKGENRHATGNKEKGAGRKKAKEKITEERRGKGEGNAIATTLGDKY